MKYRTLGRTGLRISEVGFGGGGIGGVWGETTDAELRRAVQRAIELGINFFDVAPSYGNGRAEQVLGAALQGRREQVLVTTKVSMRPEGLTDIPGFIQRTLEGSLRRLQTDHVDLLLVHNPITSIRGRLFPHAVTAADALSMAAAFRHLQDAGKVRFIGFTAWRCNKQQLAMLVDSGAFDTLQTEYNLLNQSAQEPATPGLDVADIGVLETQDAVDLIRFRYRPVDQHRSIVRAAARNMGVINIRPVLAGLLTEGVDRPIGDDPDAALMLRRAAALDFLRARDRSLTSAAFTFCLANPGVSTIVPGVKNVAEIEEAAAASAAAPLTGDEMQRIAQLYQRNFDAA